MQFINDDILSNEFRCPIEHNMKHRLTASESAGTVEFADCISAEG